MSLNRISTCRYERYRSGRASQSNGVSWLLLKNTQEFPLSVFNCFITPEPCNHVNHVGPLPSKNNRPAFNQGAASLHDIPFKVAFIILRSNKTQSSALCPSFMRSARDARTELQSELFAKIDPAAAATPPPASCVAIISLCCSVCVAAS